MKRVYDTGLWSRIERCSSGPIFSRLQHAPNACWQDNAVSWLIRLAAACVPIPRQLVPLSSPHASCKQLSPHGLHTARLAITASRASLYTFCILTFCSVYSFIFGFEHSNRRRLRFVWLPFGLRWLWSSVLRTAYCCSGYGTTKEKVETRRDPMSGATKPSSPPLECKYMY